MKPIPFIVTVILSLVTLILVINLIFLGQKTQSLQANLQAQQVEINKGSMSQQVGVNLLKAIGEASLRDDTLKQVLSKNGYSINPAASPAPSSSTPATTSTTP